MPVYFPSGGAASGLNANPASSYGALPLVYNYSPLMLPKWRAAVAKMKAGLGNAKILFAGDSTTFGEHSNGGASGDWSALSVSQQTANALKAYGQNNATGFNTSADCFFGTGNIPTLGLYRGSYDARVSLGSGWTTGSSQTMGGTLFVASAATGNLAFTPRANVDTFTVYYYQNTGQGSFSYNINGGSNTIVNSGTTPALLKSVTVPATLGANTLNLNYSSGGAVVIAGILAYNSASKTILCINAGNCGSTSANWVDNSSVVSVTSAIPAIALDLTFINLGINDWTGGVSISTYTANMQTLITNAKTSGDVVLQTPFPSATSSASTATQNSFVAALYTLAQSNSLPLIDCYNRFGSNANAVTLGMDYDALHPNGAGYADIAQAYLNLLLAV